MNRSRARLHVVLSVHDPPVWTLPGSEIDRIVRTLEHDDVVPAPEAAARHEALPDAEVLLATRLSPDECARAGRLEWIHTTAVGVGGLLSPALAARNVVVTNARGVHSEPIAEHALALVLALRRGVPAAVAFQSRREWGQLEWSTRRAPRLSGARMLVVGLGSIGARVAAMAAGLGMRVTGVRRHADRRVPPGVERVLPPERFIEALGEADAVVLAAPRTDETRALIGEPELRAMRPTAVLVNVARGGLLDHVALAAALRAGRLAGAALDALPHEPLPAGDPLWSTPNLLITPHVAAFDGDYWRGVVDLFLDNVERFRRGEALLNVVDQRLGY